MVLANDALRGGMVVSFLVVWEEFKSDVQIKHLLQVIQRNTYHCVLPKESSSVNIKQRTFSYILKILKAQVFDTKLVTTNLNRD